MKLTKTMFFALWQAYATKWLFIMRITAIGLVLVGLHVSVLAFPQNKLSLSVKNDKLEHVLTLIQNKSGFRFLYEDDPLFQTQRITLQIQNATLETILPRLLAGTGLVYSMAPNNLILLSRETVTAVVLKKVVKGRVHNENNEPLANVSISIKGKKAIGQTDADGNFSVEADGKDILLFSAIGYTMEEVAVAGQTELNVMLKVSTNKLDEVVVVGYGTQSRKNITAAVAQVDGKELENTSATGAAQALEGRVSGVQIYRNSGAPGADASITIRGIGSFANSAPLIVVDGVEGGNLNLISPDEIQNITVLKDASASAIYGANAANGVIIVTTRNGNNNGKSRLNYSYKLGLNRAANMPPLLNGKQFALLQNEAFVNAGQAPTFSDDQIKNMGAGTNWRDKILHTGVRQEHYLGFSGGTQKLNYILSGEYLNENGIAIYSWYKRLNLRTKINAQISDRLSVGVNAQFSNYSSQTGADFTAATTFTPTIPFQTPDGRPGAISVLDPGNGVTSGPNPVYNRQISLGYDNHSPTNYLFATGFGEYKLFSFLKARSSISFEGGSVLSKSFSPSYYFRNYEGDTLLSQSRLPQNRSFTQSNSQNNRYLWTNSLEFNKSFGVHNVKVLLAYQEQQYKSDSSTMIRIGGFPTNDFLSYGSTTSNVTSTAGANIYAMRSWFGRLNYDYQGKYLVEIAAREDGSSRFGPNNKYAFFPSASAGWRISSEDFFEPFKNTISDLKVRGSYGLLGNSAIPTFSYVSNVSISQGYVFNNTAAQIAALNSLPNPNIKWETSRVLNLGIDATLLKQRLGITMDFYNRKSVDLLTNVNIPATTGISNDQGILGTQLRNAAELQNRGMEWMISWNDRINSKMSYNLRFTGAYNANKVLKLSSGSTKQFGGGNNEFVDSIGQPIGAIWGFRQAGIWQNQNEIDKNAHMPTDKPGDIRYADLNHDGVIDQKDETIIGNASPKYTFGFTGGLNYGGVDLSFHFQGDWKRDFLQYGYGYFAFGQVPTQNSYAYVLNRWHGEGTTNKYPRLLANGGSTNQSSTFYVQDGSYLRLRHLEIGYTLPSRLLERVKIQRIRAYAGADNLFTLTKFYGLDPEQSGQGGAYSRDAIQYPQARTFILGINATF